MKKVLITGITGFAGSYLAEYLVAKKEYKILGTYLIEKSITNVDKIKQYIKLFKVNLLYAEDTYSVVEKTKPDLIFHLAALPSPANSFGNPQKSLTNNILSELNILDAIRINSLFNTKILVISSADIYGIVKKEDLPIDENTPLMPLSPYAVSKIAQDFLGLQYFLAYKLKIVRVRPFNHIGPRQTPHFVISSFAQQIAEIEKGKRKPVLHVGNLEAKRDFTDVRDIVTAYLLALKHGKFGEVYNIGRGMSYKIEDILSKLLSFSSSKISIKVDKSLLRPIDNPDLLCNASKFIKISGWKPKIDLDKTLIDTLDYWRKIV